MMNSPPFARRMPSPCAREAWHEDDRFRSTQRGSSCCSPICACPPSSWMWKKARRANPTRKAGRRRASSPRSPSNEVAERGPSPHRAPSCRSSSAGRQDTRDLRLPGSSPMVSKAQVMALRRWATAGLERRAPICSCSAHPAPAKSHLAAAIGLALVDKRMARAVHAHRRTRPAPADRTAANSGLRKRDRPSSTSITYSILDDIAYVSKDQAETSVLFELIGSRYERLSLLITANQTFGGVGQRCSPTTPDARRHRPPRCITPPSWR